MPKFATNLSILFPELPFFDRFTAAAQAGFKGVEFLFPYDYDKGCPRRLSRCERLGASVARPFSGAKPAVRDYLRRIFERRPDLNCTVGYVFAGVDSVALEYRFAHGLHGIEFMTVDADGLDEPGHNRLISRNGNVLIRNGVNSYAKDGPAIPRLLAQN